VVAVASAAAVFQSVRAGRLLRTATSRQLAAQAVATPGRGIARSLLLSLAALDTDDTREARSALLTSLQATDPRVAAFIEGPGGPVRSVAFSPDGRVVAAGTERGRVMLWDAEHRRRVGEPVSPHSNAVQDLVFSPNGRLLASAGFDGKVVLWETGGGRPLGEPLRLDAERVAVWNLAFGPDGRTLAAGTTVSGAPGDRKRRAVMLWDVGQRRKVGEVPVAADGDLSSIEFS
jgi:WD40 repeat protein